MRFTHPCLVFLVCTLTFVACSKNKDNPKPEKQPLRLWAGQDTVIALTGTGQYTAMSDSTQVAQVTVQNDSLHITTSYPGPATIHITGPDNRTTDLKLVANSVIGTWNSVKGGTGGWTSIEVQCSDPALAASLQEQLSEKEMKPESIRALAFRDYADLAFQEIRTDNIRRQGTFSFHDLTLTLTEGSTVEVYRLIPFTLSRFALEQDLTAQFQAIHPGKGITKVTRTRYYTVAEIPG
ncbi:hypothetical protein HB364_15490 [Pseudoflavitalea sp. X16]|uniref:hypothetical protein n=1 Tax=Paraflavitalea devenefica TaxID=2716334 RepID=UPI0014237292|nr:hypothetical protein [Paraflavitalea devenefica]NII26492.1 hypothetical protein [Paraflavitalea devenefica]